MDAMPVSTLTPTPTSIPNSTAVPTPGASPIAVRGTAMGAGESAGESSGDGDDAFIAALIAQGGLAALAPAEPLPATTAAVVEDVAAGQVLPLARPVLAALMPSALRPTLAATAVTEGDAGSDTESETIPGATVVADTQPAELEVVLRAAAGRALPDTAQVTLDDGTVNASVAATADGAVDASSARDPSAASTTTTVQAASDGAAAHQASRATAVSNDHALYAPKHAPLPPDQPGLFGERLNQQISVMLTQQSQQARLAVTPPDLGPIDVRIVVVGDEASVHLAASHAATRDALSEALPRLRAAFADSGLSLGQTGVFTEMPQRQQQEAAFTRGDGQRIELDAEPFVETTPVRLTRLGLVDAFV